MAASSDITSLYIGTMYANIKRNVIRKVFQDILQLGDILQIDFSTYRGHSKTGQPLKLKRVFIHFHSWSEDAMSGAFLAPLLEPEVDGEKSVQKIYLSALGLEKHFPGQKFGGYWVVRLSTSGPIDKDKKDSTPQPTAMFGTYKEKVLTKTETALREGERDVVQAIASANTARKIKDIQARLNHEIDETPVKATTFGDIQGFLDDAEAKKKAQTG